MQTGVDPPGQNMMPVKVRRLGLRKVLLLYAGSTPRIKKSLTKVFGELIPDSYRRFFGQALDHHWPDLDLDQVRMATEGSVNGWSGGAAVVVKD